MTEQQINIAIAEACGWTKLREGLGLKPGDIGPSRPIPDYCTDLNAMHEAEQGIDAMKYYEQLFVADVTQRLVGYRHLWHATARQRAEAFCRVKGIWKEK